MIFNYFYNFLYEPNLPEDNQKQREDKTRTRNLRRAGFGLCSVLMAMILAFLILHFALPVILLSIVFSLEGAQFAGFFTEMGCYLWCGRNHFDRDLAGRRRKINIDNSKWIPFAISPVRIVPMLLSWIESAAMSPFNSAWYFFLKVIKNLMTQSSAMLLMVAF